MAWCSCRLTRRATPAPGQTCCGFSASWEINRHLSSVPSSTSMACASGPGSGADSCTGMNAGTRRCNATLDRFASPLSGWPWQPLRACSLSQRCSSLTDQGRWLRSVVAGSRRARLRLAVGPRTVFERGPPRVRWAARSNGLACSGRACSAAHT
jgi:hypothetical protein